MNQFERRFLDRIEIPGSKVMYYTSDGNSNFVPMIDISIGSIRFETLDIILNGETLVFEVIIPSRSKISLKGNVVLIGKGGKESKDFVIVQFSPFGSIHHYNSLYSHAQLKEVFEEHAKILKAS